MSDLELTDSQATSVAKLVAAAWWDERGIEALTTLEYVRAHEPEALLAAATGDASVSAEVAKASLEAVLQSNDEAAKGWVHRAIATVKKPQAQFLDPFVGGALLILASCIGVSIVLLAGRVKSIGGVKFAVGVPKELTKIAKTAAYAPVDLAKQLKDLIE